MFLQVPDPVFVFLVVRLFPVCLTHTLRSEVHTTGLSRNKFTRLTNVQKTCFAPSPPKRHKPGYAPALGFFWVAWLECCYILMTKHFRFHIRLWLTGMLAPDDPYLVQCEKFHVFQIPWPFILLVQITQRSPIPVPKARSLVWFPALCLLWVVWLSRKSIAWVHSVRIAF